MKITAKRDHKNKYIELEAGNKYDTTKHGIPDSKAWAWYNAGIIDIEGEPPSREPVVNKQVDVAVKDTVHKSSGKV